MKKLAIIGAGGHGDAAVPFIDTSKYQLVGYFDDKDISEHNNLPILGKIAQVLDNLENESIDNVFIAIGDNLKRKEIFDLLGTKYYSKLINIIAPSATILNPSLIKGRGNFIGHNAFIGAVVEVYDNVVINTNATIEHNSFVFSHCNVAPAAVLLGSVHAYEGAFIGASSCVRQLVNIGAWSVIGLGAVVVKDTEENETYVGVPARKLMRK